MDSRATATRVSLYVNSFVISVASALVLPNVPAYVYRVGGSELVAGLVLSLFSVTMAAVSVPVSRRLEGTPAGIPIALGCLGYGASLAPFLLAPSIDTLGIARALQGACSAFSFTSSVAAAVQMGRRVVSINNLASNLGFIVGYAVSSSLSHPFRWCLALSACSAVFGLPLLSVRLRPQEEVTREHGYRSSFPAALLLTFASTLPNSAVTLIAPRVEPHYGPVIAAMTAASGLAQLLGPSLGEDLSAALAGLLAGVAGLLGYSLASVLLAGVACGLMYYAANIYSGGGRGVRAISLAIGVGYAVNQPLIGAITAGGWDGWSLSSAVSGALSLAALVGTFGVGGAVRSHRNGRDRGRGG